MTDQHERTSGRLLLHRLLDYIHEQAKDVDPRGYRLGAVRGFVRRSDELVGLLGVESDLKVAGDHIWLRIQRLEANAPPPVPDSQKGPLRMSKNPEGPQPELDEAALLHWLEKAGRERTPQERIELEAQVRAEALQSLVDYTGLWNAWAEGERPRRRTITLYADLFALKHQLEAEETAKPQEFVCGIGISYWQLQFDGSSVLFEYPLLTQAIEISLDDAYHGPDRWQEDTKRQRVLERAGWTFWRCCASTWSLHRADVVSELLERLSAMSIEPLGATDLPSVVERRVWTPPASDDDSPDEVEETLRRAVLSDGKSS